MAAVSQPHPQGLLLCDFQNGAILKIAEEKALGTRLAVSLFHSSNMAAVTSYGNSLLLTFTKSSKAMIIALMDAILAIA